MKMMGEKLALSALASVLCLTMMAACDLFTGPKGETGADGAEGPTLYLQVKSGSSTSVTTQLSDGSKTTTTGTNDYGDSVGTKIYSGGSLYLGCADYTLHGSSSSVANAQNLVISIVNKTGHSITLKKLQAMNSNDMPVYSYVVEKSAQAEWRYYDTNNAVQMANQDTLIAIDETGLSATLDAGATSGNSFSISGSPDSSNRGTQTAHYCITYTDNTTGETAVMSFSVILTSEYMAII